MKYEDDFIKDFREEAEREGKVIDGAMFIQMEKDLYIRWLENKLDKLQEK